MQKLRASRVAHGNEGGYNSSNTCHLAALSARHGVRTYHIEDATGIDAEAGTIRHQPVRQKRDPVEGPGWLGEARVIGVTAGASTPNNKIGEALARVCATAGIDLRSALVPARSRRKYQNKRCHPAQAHGSLLAGTVAWPSTKTRTIARDAPPPDRSYPGLRTITSRRRRGAWRRSSGCGKRWHSCSLGQAMQEALARRFRPRSRAPAPPLAVPEPAAPPSRKKGAARRGARKR